jgi:hypothetical protein
LTTSFFAAGFFAGFLAFFAAGFFFVLVAAVVDLVDEDFFAVFVPGVALVLALSPSGNEVVNVRGRVSCI